MTQDKKSVRTEALDDVSVQLTRDGQLVDDTNPIPVEVVEGGASPQAEHLVSASLAPAASETLQATLIPAGVTGRLEKVTVAAEGAWRALIRKTDGVTPVTIAVIYGEAGSTQVFQPKNPRAALYAQAGDGAGTRYEIDVENNEPAAVGDSHVIRVTIEWDEA